MNNQEPWEEEETKNPWLIEKEEDKKLSKEREDW